MSLDPETIQTLIDKLINMAVEFGPKLFTATVILVIGFFAGRWLGGVLNGWLNKLEMEPPLRMLLVRFARIVVLAVFLMMALQNLGVELLPLIAGLGIAGVGVGLAMQGVLGNLVAGLTIIFTRPFRVGEYVSMAGEEGRVESIELFMTTLSHPDLSRVLVPNRKIVGEILHNYGRIRQLDVVVGVAYATDLNAAIAAIQSVLQASSRCLKEPAPVIRVIATADSSINIAVKPWVNVPDYGKAIGEVNQGIVEEFRRRNISIPFPQREIRMLNQAA
jgi:small conductance mechanosensitive channel